MKSIKELGRIVLASVMLIITAGMAYAADIPVFTVPGYEAAIKTLGPNTALLLNDGTTVRIGITGNGGVVTWTTLSIPAGKTLDFFFTQDGQYALNNVLNGMSRIAGTLSSSGADGTIVISNPNGVIIDGTGVVNAGGVFFTTHEIDYWDGELNGEILTSMKKGTDGKYHGIAIKPGAIINVGNFTLASSGNISINGANIMSQKDTVLVTSDGLVYAAGQIDGYSLTHGSGQGNIKIADSSFKTTEGKIVLRAHKGDADITRGSMTGSTDIVSSKDTNIYKTTFSGDLNVDSQNDAFLQEVVAGANAVLKAANDVIYASYLTDGSVSTVAGNLSIDAGNYALAHNVTISGNTTMTSAGDADFIVSRTNNLSMNTLGDAGFFASTVYNDAALTGKNVTVQNIGADLPIILGTLNATASEKITLLNNTVQPADEYPLRGTIDAPVIDINNFLFRSAPVVPPDEGGTPLTGDTEAATYVNRMAVGAGPNITPAEPVFTPRGFAAEDITDYKEQFLRKYVKKPNNIVTTNIFKAE